MATNQKQGSRQTKETRQKSRLPGPVRQAPVPLLETADLEVLQRAAIRPSLAAPADILALQRSYGNRAVQRLIGKRYLAPVARGPHRGGGQPAVEGLPNSTYGPRTLTQISDAPPPNRAFADTRLFSTPANPTTNRHQPVRQENTGARGGTGTIQRLIVTGPDKATKDLVIMGSIGLYLSERADDDVQLLGVARYDQIARDEPLYIVAHGKTTEVGDMSPDQMYTELTTAGRRLPTTVKEIGIAACEAGKQVNLVPSFAKKLQGQLRLHGYPHIVVKGPPGTCITNRDDLTEMVVENEPEAQKIMDQLMPDQKQKEINAFLATVPGLKARAKAAIGIPQVTEMFRGFLRERKKWEKAGASFDIK